MWNNCGGQRVERAVDEVLNTRAAKLGGMTYESGHDANGLAAIARALAQASASASASASAPAVAQAAEGGTPKKSKAQQVGSSGRHGQTVHGRVDVMRRMWLHAPRRHRADVVSAWVTGGLGAPTRPLPVHTIGDGGRERASGRAATQ